MLYDLGILLISLEKEVHQIFYSSFFFFSISDSLLSNNSLPIKK